MRRRVLWLAIAVAVIGVGIGGVRCAPAPRNGELDLPAPDDWSLVPQPAHAPIREAIEACRRDPKDARAMERLARVYHGNEQIPLAVIGYERALALGSTDARTSYLLGLLERQAGRTTEAIAALQRAASLDPSYAPTHYNLGLALLDGARLEEAIVALDDAVRLGAGTASFHAGLGRALRQEGRFEEAERALRRALALDPTDVEAHQLLGLTLQALDRPDEAREHLERPVSHRDTVVSDPWLLEVQRLAASPAILLDRAAALLARGRLESALELLRDAAKAHPDDAATRRLLGKALLQEGQPDEAIAAYLRAVELEPRDAEAHAALAVIYSQQGRTDDAEREAGLALGVDPGHPMAAMVRANLALRRGAPDEALSILAPLLDRRSDLVAAHVVHGEALAALGRLDEAVAAFARAVELEPEAEFPRRRLAETRSALDGSGSP